MARGVFHGILYHLVSPCQEDFCPVLGMDGNNEEVSAKLDNSVARVKAGLKGRQGLLEGGDQRGRSTITKTHPNNSEFSVGTAGKMKKVFVLANDHPGLGFGVARDLNVRCFGQADLQNVLTV